MEQHPVPIKKPVSSKHPSLISSTRVIKKKHAYATHTQVRSADLFLSNEVCVGLMSRTIYPSVEAKCTLGASK